MKVTGMGVASGVSGGSKVMAGAGSRMLGEAGWFVGACVTTTTLLLLIWILLKASSCSSIRNIDTAHAVTIMIEIIQIKVFFIKPL